MLFPFGFMQAQGPSYDADAVAFFNRVAAAGGTLTLTEKTAVNTLVVTMKADGTWTPMKAVYPMVGASSAACAQNLKSSSFTGTFTSGWTFASTGVTPNGTSAYMDTALSPSANLTSGNTHASVYLRTDTAAGAKQEIGTIGAVSVGSEYSLLAKFTGNLAYPIISSNTNLLYPTYSNTNSQGFWIINRENTTNIQYYNRSTKVIDSAQTNGMAIPNIYIGARNNNSTADRFTDRQFAFASIGDGLTSTQASNFYTAVQTFNQTLNRQVGAQVVSDADAQAYINRVYTAGGTLTNTEATAVNQLTIDMKAAGVWTAMKAVYPMVGASAAACAQNLKSSSFTGTFSSGWSFDPTGVIPNGTSAYFDTAFNPTGNLSVNSQCFSYYSRSNTAAGSKREMGGYNATSVGGNEDVGLLAKFTGDIFYSIIGGTTFPNVSNTDSRGLFIINRTSASNVKGYKNSSLVINATNSTVILLNMPIYIGCRNTNTVPGDFSDRQCAFASIGDGLTDTQASNLYTLVQTFQTTLGRAIAP